MRHISHLSEVQLCARPLRPPFDQLRYPGGRRTRVALDRAVGWVHLEDWKTQKVGDPIPYFRSALQVLSPSYYSQAPGQAVVEQVLQTAFQGAFSATLANSTLTQIYGNLRGALKQTLRDIDLIKAITQGFEDMVLIPDPPQVQLKPAPEPGPLPAPRPQYLALEEALGAAFIDYFNGYDVGDITQAFIGYGGTDQDQQNALLRAFAGDFTTSLKNADTGRYARDAMNKFAPYFAPL